MNKDLNVYTFSLVTKAMQLLFMSKIILIGSSFKTMSYCDVLTFNKH